MLSDYGRVSVLACLAGFSASLCLEGCAGTLADPQEFSYLSEAGSAAELEAGGGTACTAAAVPVTILQQTCGAAGCHSPPSLAQGLDLATSGVASRLINVPSTEVPTDDLINSTDAQQSYLLLKLLPGPPQGLRMPYGLPPLSSDQVDCVQEWIESVVLDAGSPETTDDGSADASLTASDGGGADASLTRLDSGSRDAGKSGVLDASTKGVSDAR